MASPLAPSILLFKLQVLKHRVNIFMLSHRNVREVRGLAAAATRATVLAHFNVVLT